MKISDSIKEKLLVVLGVILFSILIYSGFNSMNTSAFNIPEVKAYLRHDLISGTKDSVTTKVFLIPNNLIMVESVTESRVYITLSVVQGTTKTHAIGPIYFDDDGSIRYLSRVEKAYETYSECIEVRSMELKEGGLRSGDTWTGELLIYENGINLSELVFSEILISEKRKNHLKEYANETLEKYLLTIEEESQSSGIDD